MAHGDAAVEDTAATAGDEVSTTERDRLLHQAGGERATEPRVKHGQPLAKIPNLVDGMLTHFGDQLMDNRCAVVIDQAVDHVLEEAAHDALRRVDGELRGIDECGGRWVEFEDGKRVLHRQDCTCLWSVS